MHLVVQRADLARALTAVQKAVEKRTTIPILSCVLLTAEDGKLAVRGTDLDIEISANVPATVSADGSAAVDAGRLGDIAKKLTGEPMTAMCGWRWLDSRRRLRRSSPWPVMRFTWPRTPS